MRFRVPHRAFARPRLPRARARARIQRVRPRAECPEIATAALVPTLASARAAPTDLPMNEASTVVIVGAGFGGLTAARALRGAPVHVTVVDRTNHHLFQPLLYQVAMAGLSPAEIAAPIRGVLSQDENTDVMLAEVVDFDLARKKVLLVDGELAYEWLIVAAGARTSYFGHAQWERVAPGLKTVEDATEIRRRVLTTYELAEREADAARRRELLTFVVVGAGPTGVELAGALAELARTVLARDFRAIKPHGARVVLVEGGERVLPAMPPDLSRRAREQLEELGVEVRLDARVSDVDEHGVTLGGERVLAATTVWAAGVAPSPLAEKLGAPRDRQGRVVVGRDLSLPAHPEVFVLGDMARVEQDGQPLPGLSPVAMQQGRYVARAIALDIGGEPREPFRYRDKGSMATIGRSRAVAESGRLHLSGLIAWLAWLFVHVFYLIGFRNRTVVLFTWAWSYLTYRRGARIITPRTWAPHSSAPLPRPLIRAQKADGTTRPEHPPELAPP
jgi:NADH:ubiquinone reductase (H+-translocating)